MNHWIIAPVVLPAVLAPFTVMVLRHHLDLERIFSVAGTLVLVVVTLALLGQASDGAIQVYELGAWPAPFGIVLVLDRLAAMMIVLTSVLALVVLLYAIGTGWDERGRHFHALFQFQLMGLLGAFLTGDAFNLFVFFEVLLIASYGLMIHGGGGRRLQAGVQYVVYNLIGSALFLLALGTLYVVTGTLNMADLAVRVAAISTHDTSLIRVGAVLLLLVFAIKAAVLPLHFWLPATYASAPLPVAALFAIMTKVGAYAILRIYTLVFGPDLAITHGLASDWLMPAALATMAVGCVGILGSREIARLAAFATISSVGTLLIAVSLFTPQAAAAAIYYTVHSTLASAVLFLIADLVTERRGGTIALGPPMPQSGLIAAFFFIAAIAMIGMPPLSGYVGKLLVMQAALASPQVWWIWAVILAASLIALAGMARAGSILFWKPHDAQLHAAQQAESDPDPEQAPGSEPERPVARPVPSLPFVAVSALLGGLAALTVLAGPAMDYADATAAQLFAPAEYIGAVLKGP